MQQRRAEFYQHARSRADTIAGALDGSPWDRGVALAFLAVLPDDVPAVLDRGTSCSGQVEVHTQTGA
jgi:hypothetical protein